MWTTVIGIVQMIDIFEHQWHNTRPYTDFQQYLRPIISWWIFIFIYKVQNDKTQYNEERKSPVIMLFIWYEVKPIAFDL